LPALPIGLSRQPEAGVANVGAPRSTFTGASAKNYKHAVPKFFRLFASSTLRFHGAKSNRHAAGDFSLWTRSLVGTGKTDAVDQDKTA
jgi:hypothetical protein